MDRLKAVLRDANIGRRRLVRFNFYRCHMAYFLATILVCSWIMYGSNTGPVGETGDGMRYIDAFFMAASSMTGTGLSTVDLSSVNGSQQSVLFVLMLLGDLSTVSVSVVLVRRWFFRRQLSQKVRQSVAARRIVEGIDEERALRRQEAGSIKRRLAHGSEKRPGHRDQDQPRSAPRRFSDHPHQHHLGSLPLPWQTALWSSIAAKPAAWLAKRDLLPEHHLYLSFEPHLDSRGRFRKLKHPEYEELGGVEYRALRLLSWILPTYTAFWVLLPMVILAPYASGYRPVADLLEHSQPGHLNPGWWGVFMALSSYTNCGLDLLNASMVPLKSNWLVLIVTGAAILAGNTFYPIFLRVYIWMLWKLVPSSSEMHHSLSFLLHHPRRCYLWLFDKKTTLVLAATQFTLIATEWVLFEVLNIHQTAVWSLRPGTRTIDGLYQSLGTRSSGIYIVTISSFAPALQVIYLVVMYFSVFPVLITLRNTNVYEEQSVGLDAEAYEAASSASALESKKERSRKSSSNSSGGGLTGLHIRNQLAYDLWWIFLSWCVICIIEEPQLNTAAPGYSDGKFAVLFEVVSAYGNCGLSLGVPYDDYSLCATFHTLSKLVLVTVMLRGRHRILPLAIDRSILIPGEATMAALDAEYAGGGGGDPVAAAGATGARAGADPAEALRRVREAQRGRGQTAELPDGRRDPDCDGSVLSARGRGAAASASLASDEKKET
ncbi:cation transport protein-domain-containing protein [Xylariaceae sp. FL0804]|nr:cation transport protein-domain-containing protein [Xylariaceae sp. FL0804]